MSRTHLLVVCAVFGLVVSAAPDASARTALEPAAAGPAVAAVPRPDHVVVVVEENHSNQQIMGNASAPYINSLAASGANFSNFFAETHPSQPNYLALFSGSTQGVTNDSCPHTFTAPNLGGAAIAANVGFTGYSEDLPSVGFTGCTSGKYARKHNPWSDFTDVPASANRSFADFPSDYTQLPAVSFVMPNLDHDMHDGTIAQGDTWLQNNLGGYVTWAKTHNSLLVVTFDEDDNHQANKIPTFIVGQQVQPGNYAETLNHYNLLRTIQDAYGLAPTGASATAAPILDIWQPAGGNQPPVAVFSGSCGGLSCSFDGSGSSDPDGSVASWAWSFGDGGSGSGETVPHTYAAGGAVTVTLTVTDGQGATSSVSHVFSPVAPAGTPFVSDAFNRTASRGWGSADVGGAWSAVGTLTQFSVSPGGGVLSLAKAPQQLEVFAGPAQTDADVTEVWSANRVPVGGLLHLSVMGRRVSAGNYYSAKVLVNPNGSLTLQVARTAGGAATVLAGPMTVPGLTYTAGMSLSMRVQVFGTSPTTVRAKVWRTGQAEPSSWQVSATDSTAGFQTGGTVGTIAYLSNTVTNAPVNVTVTSFTAQPTSGPPANQPPVARFTSSCDELSCSFDAGTSSDPDGSIASYAWDLGDGSTGTGQTLPHAYVVAGTYSVTLTVTDNSGATSSVTHVVTPTEPPPDQPPTARFTSSCTNLTCSFDGTTSSDPEDVTVSSYSWDLGDGQSAGQGAFSHTFPSAGTYDVTLTVADDDDATDQVTHEVVVTAAQQNQPPVAVFSGSCGGLSCSFDGSGSSDPDGSVASWAWSFGDGGSGSGETVPHTYAAGGAVTVTLTVTDGQGATSSVSHVFSPVAPAGTPFVSDAFNRTASRGWGSADVGGAWSAVGTLTQFSVSPGGGVLSLAKAPQQLEVFAGPAQTDADVTEVWSANRVPVGGLLHLSVMGRRVSAGNYYSAKVLVNPNGSLTLQVARTAGGAATVLAGPMTVPGLTYTAGMSLSMRVQVFGTSPTTVRAKVWRTGQAEPSSWQVSATDSTAGFQTGGTVGTIAYLSNTVTNAPVNVTVTSFNAQPTP